MEHAISFTDWIPAAIICLLTFLYCFGWWHRKTQKIIRWQHATCFCFGMLLLFIAYLPQIMHWGHLDMRGHMAQHLLIAMFAPIFMVLGRPITLLLQTLPASTARKLSSLMKTNFFSLLAHPVFAFILNIGGMYLLYLSPLYNQMQQQPMLHHIVHLHFLLAGYIFTWSIIGTNPAGPQKSFKLRLIVLFVSIAAHTFLSKAMYAYVWPAESIHTIQQIKEGAKLMYYWGDLSEILLLIIFFTMWYKGKNNSYAIKRA